MKRNLILNYKSGKSTRIQTEMRIEEYKKKIQSGTVDINPKDFSLIRWGEVESVTPE